MAEGVQVAAFEGGQLRTLAGGEVSREAVLALPLSRLIVKMVRVPPENREDPVAFATPLLQAMSPYPDEPLTVSVEQVREDERGLIVIAAALPESATDDIGEAIDGAKLNITRIDALAIGALRGLWNALGTDDGERRLVLLNTVDGISVIALDGDSPSAIRAVNAASALKREMMLSLLEAEDFGGAKPLKEIVLVENGAQGETRPTEDEVKVEGEGEQGDLSSSENEENATAQPLTLDIQPLEAFAPVRKIEIGEDAALVGVAERSADPNALNALPQSWREMLEESRFKAKMVKYLAIAGGIWGLLLGVIFGVPFTFGLMTDHQKQLCREHRHKFEEVREMKSKVELVRKYSDHTRGSLNIMWKVSDSLNDIPGITLNNWVFKRDGGLTIAGEGDFDDVLNFKNKLVAMVVTDEDNRVVTDATGSETTLFPEVKLRGPTATRGGKYKFDIECLYETEGEE